METQKDRFLIILTAQYERLFQTPAYAIAASKATPREAAERMVSGLLAGTADKEGEGVKNTCKALGVKPTYKAIREFLSR